MVLLRLRSALAIATLIASGGLMAGCDDGDVKNDPVGESESAWGFLAESSLAPTSPQYLVNKKRGESFRVCLAKYMADALPGVSTELEAAVNVWASYLGRSIPVQIEIKDLPRARAEQTVDDVGAAYQTACGQGYDVVVGFAKIEGSAVGLTGASYRYVQERDGSRRITSFSRYLFLRDYDLVPTMDDDVAERWVSLAAESGASTTAPELLASMLARSKTTYAKAGAYLSLPVLTHEIGHVWGLCDQYESSNNCDPMNSSSHRVEASIMGARGATQRLFLTDDDIEGIRALGNKRGFAHDWGAPPADPAAAIVRKPVELARIEKVGRDAGALVVTYGVVTSVAARYEFALQGQNETRFTPLTSDFRSASPLDVPTGKLRISLSTSRADKYKVRLVVTPESGEAQTIVAAEP